MRQARTNGQTPPPTEPSCHEDHDGDIGREGQNNSTQSPPVGTADTGTSTGTGGAGSGNTTTTS